MLHNQAAAKHAAFLKARVKHYSNEAEAMKVHHHKPDLPKLLKRNSIPQKAQQLMVHDDDQEESQDGPKDEYDEDASMDDDLSTNAVRTNGID